ncbi:MAG: Flp pilus assembly protein CpaB [Actinomycetota bacterium]|nr:Flp pilus assembly protein CpaB [Actinomycetota bacterium]
MNYRAKNIGIAVALAALAAILTSAYVVNYKRHVQRGEGKVTVLVAARDIPAGTSGADVVDQKMLKEQTVPRKSVVAGAISAPDQLAQYVATQDVYTGEQVSTRRFAPPTEQGIRAQIKGTQRAYELAGDPNQLLAGTLKEGDHIDVVGNWTVKVGGSNGADQKVTRVILRNVLVLRAPIGGAGGATVTSGSDKSQNVQVRVTDIQVQKLFWIEKNGDWHLTLRPPVNSVDSGNTIQEVSTMFFDGPGRRP